MTRSRARRRTPQPGDAGGLDAILVTTSGCGTVIKDYGYMLREDRKLCSAARSPRLRKTSPNISPASNCSRRSRQAASSSPITWPVRCSMDRKSGTLRNICFPRVDSVVKDVPESYCVAVRCSYNILQPDIAQRLRDRKVANIASVKPDMIAAGNIGCMIQIAGQFLSYTRLSFSIGRPAVLGQDRMNDTIGRAIARGANCPMEIASVATGASTKWLRQKRRRARRKRNF